jgi:hypothetical protein
VAPFTANNPEGGFHLGPGFPAVAFRSSDYDRFAESVELRYAGLARLAFSMPRQSGRKNGEA